MFLLENHDKESALIVVQSKFINCTFASPVTRVGQRDEISCGRDIVLPKDMR
jgi:hypothetical protein